MTSQNPFHFVQSTVCTCLELVTKMNRPCHGKGQRGQRGLASCGQPPGSTQARLPGHLSLSEVALFWQCCSVLQCAAVELACHPRPSPCQVDSTETDPPRHHGARPHPLHLQGKTLQQSRFGGRTEVTTGFCSGLHVRHHPPAKRAVSSPTSPSCPE